MERLPYRFNNISIKNIKDTELLEKFAIICIKKKATRRDVILQLIKNYVKTYE